MSLFSKWKVIEERRKLLLKYGDENARVAVRKHQMRKATPTAHSFPHLLNKEIMVPKPNWRPFYTEPNTIRSYGITDRELAAARARNAALLATRLDNDESEF